MANSQNLKKQQLQRIIQREETEIKLAIAQNATLRAQINPHFLFNSLSFFIKGLEKWALIRGKVILLLSGIMRYSIESTQDEKLVNLFT
jgi:sensor histidine kinase YesM